MTERQINSRMGNYTDKENNMPNMNNIKLPRNCYIIPVEEWTNQEIVMEWFHMMRYPNSIPEFGPTKKEIIKEIKKRANEGR